MTLAAAVCAPFILQSVKAQRWWIYGQLGLAVVVVILIQLFPDQQALARGQASISGSNTIGVGRLLGAGTIIAVLHAICVRRARIFTAIVALGLGAALLIVGNRASFIAVVVTVICTALLSRRFSGVRLRILAVVSIGLACAATAVATGKVGSSSRISALLQGSDSTVLVSNNVRQSLLEVAIRTSADNPIGVGWGGLSSMPELASGLGENVYPHNVVAELFAEGGWLAGMGFLVFLSLAISRLRRVSETRINTLLLSLAIYWTVVALFSEDINGNRMMWISLALAFGIPAAGRAPKDRTVGTAH
ncbi:O-antigen ligase family protein [Georgenia sp. MJ173]|uniref:O-antigen ligase family protein n=1 Tax=Georgenia sunbinii TaxID=3117728 RepID=UPI002F2609E5